MLKTETINQLLGIKESYQAPQKMLDIMLDDEKRPKLFDDFLEHESNLDYEWFQGYFESEHADRKEKKQDFTPNAVSQLGARILGYSDSYFEATVGTGGMMIQFWNQNPQACFRVEELSDRSIPFLLFNMSIRGMDGVVKHGDSLSGKFEAMYELTKQGQFSEIRKAEHVASKLPKSVLMNPPFSAKWEQKSDERFEKYGLAPKSKADFAFLLHGYSRLEKGGKMAIVLPHGVLFRGASEGKIRTALLKEGAISSIIGLPENIFYGTGIPTVLIVLEKERESKDVFFMDASKEFEKGKNKNVLKDQHIKKIFNAYESKEEMEKFSRMIPFKEIVENDFNLNIPRYIDTFEEEELIDLGEVANELMQIDAEIDQAEKELGNMARELTSNDPKLEIDLEIMLKALGIKLEKPSEDNQIKLDL